MCRRSLKDISKNNKRRRNENLIGKEPLKAKTTYAAIKEAKIRIAKRMVIHHIEVEIIADCLSVTKQTASKYIEK